MLRINTAHMGVDDVNIYGSDGLSMINVINGTANSAALLNSELTATFNANETANGNEGYKISRKWFVHAEKFTSGATITLILAAHQGAGKSTILYSNTWIATPSPNDTGGTKIYKEWVFDTEMSLQGSASTIFSLYLRSDNAADTAIDIKYAVYNADISTSGLATGGYIGGRVDVGTILGAAPLSENTIAETVVAEMKAEGLGTDVMVEPKEIT